jgi:hypothetical protein
MRGEQYKNMLAGRNIFVPRGIVTDSRTNFGCQLQCDVTNKPSMPIGPYIVLDFRKSCWVRVGRDRDLLHNNFWTTNGLQHSDRMYKKLLEVNWSVTMIDFTNSEYQLTRTDT